MNRCNVDIFCSLSSYSSAIEVRVSSQLFIVLLRDVEAEVEAGSGSGKSGPFSVEAEARKTYHFRFHVGYLT